VAETTANRQFAQEVCRLQKLLGTYVAYVFMAFEDEIEWGF